MNEPAIDARLRRREAMTLVAIIAAAFAVRLLLISFERLIRWDEPDYLTLGVNLFSGLGYTTGLTPELHYAPLFPIVVGLLWLLVGSPELASNIVYVLAGALLVLPVYAIARRIYGQWTAAFVACLLSLFPALTASVLFWGTMTEPLHLLLVYTGFYAALLAIEDDHPWAYIAAGVLLSLAYLTRPEAAITFLLILGYLVLLRLTQRRLLRRATMLRLLAFVLAFALVAAPYFGFLYAKSGRLLLSGKLGLTYAMGQAVLDKDMASYDRLISSLDTTGTQIVWYSEQRFSYSVIDDVVSDPLAFARRIFANTRVLTGLLFGHTVFPTALGIPLLLGLMDAAWDRRRLRRELFLMAIVAAPLLSFLPFHIEIRFFAPLLPVLLMWTGNGLVYLAHWLVRTRNTIWPPVADLRRKGMVHGVLGFLPFVAVMSYCAVALPFAMQNGRSTLDWTHKDAGLWLKQNAPAGAIIMTRDLAIAVYAGRPWIPSPNAAIDASLRYARHHGADYYVVDDGEINNLRPQLKPLLDQGNPPSGLQHEETFSDGKRRTIIYRIP